MWYNQTVRLKKGAVLFGRLMVNKQAVRALISGLILALAATTLHPGRCRQETKITTTYDSRIEQSLGKTSAAARNYIYEKTSRTYQEFLKSVEISYGLLSNRNYVFDPKPGLERLVSIIDATESSDPNLADYLQRSKKDLHDLSFTYYY